MSASKWCLYRREEPKKDSMRSFFLAQKWNPGRINLNDYFWATNTRSRKESISCGMYVRTYACMWYGSSCVVRSSSLEDSKTMETREKYQIQRAPVVRTRPKKGSVHPTHMAHGLFTANFVRLPIFRGGSFLVNHRPQPETMVGLFSYCMM